MAELNVSVDQFNIIKFLGSGATGTVFEAEDNIIRSHVAIKVIKKSLLRKMDIRNVVKEQQAFMQTTGNLQAVQLLASFHDTVNFYMVMVNHFIHQCVQTADVA